MDKAYAHLQDGLVSRPPGTSSLDDELMRSQKTWRRLLAILLSFVFTLCCLLPAWDVLSQGLIPVVMLRRSLRIYPDSTFLFDDWLPLTGSANLHTLFYWTPDSREQVAKYYQTAVGSLVEADLQDSWLITAYHLNGSKPALDTTNGSPVTYSDFCLDDWQYGPRFQCVTVSLVRTNHPKLCLLPIVNGDGKSMLETPYNYCDQIPKTGTLIIFKFAEGDPRLP